MAAYITGQTFEEIDSSAVSRTKQILAYHLALAFRAIKAKKTDGLRAIELANELSEGCGSCTIIGHARKVTLVDAAFTNCTLMRALGLDDVIFPAGIHAGLMTLPVALGIGERSRRSGKELITAVVAGYEILGKFGRFAWAFDSPRRPTMPFGPFGSLTTAAKMLGLDHDQTVVALAYAAHTAMGLAEHELGPVTHYYSLICRNAIVGAYSARAGAWGSPTVLEGRHGFLETFQGFEKIDGDELVASLGRDLAVLESCEKRYPGTALNQVAIELMRQLVIEAGLTANDVASIIFTIPKERARFEAGHMMGPFTSSGAASSSFTFQCAILLLDGEQNSRRYDDFANTEIQTVIDRMSVKFVEGKRIRYSRIDVQTTDRRAFSVEGDDFKFEPGRTQAVLSEAARDLLPANRIEQLAALIDSLEEVDDVSGVMTCLMP